LLNLKLGRSRSLGPTIAPEKTRARLRALRDDTWLNSLFSAFPHLQDTFLVAPQSRCVLSGKCLVMVLIDLSAAVSWSLSTLSLARCPPFAKNAKDGAPNIQHFGFGRDFLSSNFS